MQFSVETLPEETLVYLLGSRYCDTDNLVADCLATFRAHNAGMAAGAGSV